MRVGPDGSFGPLRVDGRKHYEATLLREGERTYHYYFEPFGRSDRFLRSQVSRPGGVADYVDRCESHTAVTVIRNREWWADQPDEAANDQLLVNGTDVLAPAVAPRVRQVISAFVFDDDCDRRSIPGTVLPPFDALPFLTGVDTYLPASPTAAGTIRVTQVARGTDGRFRTVAVRNWSSVEHSVTVQFKDYLD